MKPFRFGVNMRTVVSATEWAARARNLEDQGYSTLCLPDHLAPMLAPLPALAIAAAATRRLRVGTMVLNNDFRHPAVLAREAATLDVLSDGRLELGLGAGHMKSEYDEAGLPFDRGGVRVERLAEAVIILKRLFDGEPVTFHGRHYQVNGHTIYPKPVQQPRPPILIGGNGPRLLTLAAAEADIVGFSGITFARGGVAPDFSGFRAGGVDDAAAARARGRGRPLRSARAERAAPAGHRHRRSPGGRRGAGAALDRGHGRRRARESLRAAWITWTRWWPAAAPAAALGHLVLCHLRKRTPTPWRRSWPVSPEPERTRERRCHREAQGEGKTRRAAKDLPARKAAKGGNVSTYTVTTHVRRIHSKLG